LQTNVLAFIAFFAYTPLPMAQFHWNQLSSLPKVGSQVGNTFWPADYSTLENKNALVLRHIMLFFSTFLNSWAEGLFACLLNCWAISLAQIFCLRWDYKLFNKSTL
jgi:hypothetical protein